MLYSRAVKLFLPIYSVKICLIMEILILLGKFFLSLMQCHRLQDNVDVLHSLIGLGGIITSCFIQANQVIHCDKGTITTVVFNFM